MTLLIIGLIVFLGTHSISIVAPAWRDAIAARMGNGWRAIYSVSSLIGLVLIIKGYATARMEPTVVYTSPLWLHHVTAALMVLVFPLLLATYLPGRIKTMFKHPMLNAVKFWAFAHLLSNGTLNDIVLFGSFLLWAVADRISVKRRPARPLNTFPESKYNDAIAVVGGLALYFLMIHWLHYKLIGVVPIL
jgi:uncharacterized membrane protein